MKRSILTERILVEDYYEEELAKLQTALAAERTHVEKAERRGDETQLVLAREIASREAAEERVERLEVAWQEEHTERIRLEEWLKFERARAADLRGELENLRDQIPFDEMARVWKITLRR